VELDFSVVNLCWLHQSVVDRVADEEATSSFL
jgi:hypothetical protein